MELQYYYSVCEIFDANTSDKQLICLFWGETLKDLAKDILNFFEPTLRSSVELFNEIHDARLDFDSSSLYSGCIRYAFGIAPIIQLRDKLKSGKDLTAKDFKDIDFYQHCDGSSHVTFSNVADNIRDLRDYCASAADVFGFYDDLPRDFEMEIDEEKIVTSFIALTKKWIASRL